MLYHSLVVYTHVHHSRLWYNLLISPGSVWGESACRNTVSDANFLIVSNNNYGSILLSFQDMTNHIWMALKMGQQKCITTSCTMLYHGLDPLTFKLSVISILLRRIMLKNNSSSSCVCCILAGFAILFFLHSFLSSVVLFNAL